jgi:hypothetical protein
MDFSFVDSGNRDFDPRTYLSILIAIAKSDKDNGPPEFDFVRRQADRLKLDYDYFFKHTDKSFLISKQTISRLTALVVIKDAIMLASMDQNFSLPEKQRVYEYAEKLDIARKDVDRIEELIQDYRQLKRRWSDLVKEEIMP